MRCFLYLFLINKMLMYFVFFVCSQPQNILLTDTFPNGEVKLCDFGISRLMQEKIEIREIMGTVEYMRKCFFVGLDVFF